MIGGRGRKYYFQIRLIKGTMLKIGVSRSNQNDKPAFSDTNNGWALFEGSLRNGSNFSGSKYSEKAKEEDVVGVMLDTRNGTLSFTLNGNYEGVAFRD